MSGFAGRTKPLASLLLKVNLLAKVCAERSKTNHDVLTIQNHANRRRMKVKAISGSLEGAIEKIRSKSHGDWRVYYLAGGCQIPYNPRSKMVENHPVTVFNQSATCVGVASIATSSVTEMIVSDSFTPCVPVIAIGHERASLAHFNGTGLSDQFAASCRSNQCTKILVIQRTAPQKQIDVSNAIFGGLKTAGFDVELATVPLSGTIGVMVIGSNVLVYPISL